MLKNFKIQVALVLGLVLAGFATALYADVSATQYRPLTTVPALQQSISSANTTTWSATPLNPVATNTNPTVAVYCAFTTASATATIECGLYFKDADGTYTYLGPAGAKVTATAAAAGNVDKDGNFPALNIVTFDTRGANYVDVRATTISAGTFKDRVWCYGSATK